jgi:hypothetical protein
VFIIKGLFPLSSVLLPYFSLSLSRSRSHFLPSLSRSLCLQRPHLGFVSVRTIKGRSSFLRSPGQAPYGARSACARRAAYPDPPPVFPDPESLAAQAAYPFGHSAIAQGSRSRFLTPSYADKYRHRHLLQMCTTTM